MRISLSEAAELLNNDGVVAVPTETVYGLAARLTSQDAIAKIFQLKGRPSNNPLIIHLKAPNEITAYASTLPEGFKQLSEYFWPGPLTLVIPVNTDVVPSMVRAGLPTAAFRVPSNAAALQLLRTTGPLVMPSANISGRPSATSPDHVEMDFGRDFPVLDGYGCKCGLESTILIFLINRWRIIRLGSLPSDAFIPVLGYAPDLWRLNGADKPICPGQLYRHYAPKARLKITEKFDSTYQGAIVGFSDRHYPSGAILLLLGPSNDPLKVAENLYSILRELDARGISSALIDGNFPKKGLWASISERFQKATDHMNGPI